MGEEEPERIRIAEPIRPVHSGVSRASDTKEDINTALEQSLSIDDEEKARRIAEEDLNHSHKQVCTFSDLFSRISGQHSRDVLMCW